MSNAAMGAAEVTEARAEALRGTAAAMEAQSGARSNSAATPSSSGVS